MTRARPGDMPDPIRQPFRTSEVGFGGAGPAGGVCGSARFDDERLPFIVDLTWEHRQDVFECIDLGLHLRPSSAGRRGITQRKIRAIPVDDLILDAVGALFGGAAGVRFPGGSDLPLSEGLQLAIGGSGADCGDGWLEPSEATTVLADLHRARRHGGRATSDARNIVARRRQGMTTEDLAESLGMEERQLRRLLSKEQRRQAGGLPAPPDGQPDA